VTHPRQGEHVGFLLDDGPPQEGTLEGDSYREVWRVVSGKYKITYRWREEGEIREHVLSLMFTQWGRKVGTPEVVDERGRLPPFFSDEATGTPTPVSEGTLPDTRAE
jgi:hypothetical protein